MQEICYSKDRFTNLSSDQFDCIICNKIVRNPRECQGCGHLFGAKCIEKVMEKQKICPKQCDPTKNKITQITSKALLRIYNDLEIKCSNFEKCKKICKLGDLEQHEKQCLQIDCKNVANCGQKSNSNFTDQVCSLACQLQMKIINQDQKQQLTIIKQFLNEVQKPMQNLSIVNSSAIINNSSLIQSGILNGHQFKWSPKHAGTGIEVTNGGLGVWLKEPAYMFRTIIADTPFMSGLHYWEIIADDRTENELKIGVACKQEFNYNQAFCDNDFGFSYYGLGQLRHSSNASGPQYGKRFKKEGILGCFLNMNKGQLSFALNGEFLGIAFNSDLLKRGPIFPAVSLLHCAGCKTDSSKSVPAYFPL